MTKETEEEIVGLAALTHKVDLSDEEVGELEREAGSVERGRHVTGALRGEAARRKSL